MALPDLIAASHPALVHLPIGGLMAAAAIEAVTWRQPARVAVARRAVLVLSLAGMAGSIVAGWILAEDYAPGAVALHRLLAFISFAVGLTALVTDGAESHLPAGAWWRRGSLLACVALVGATGHEGGLIGRGHDYYTKAWEHQVAVGAEQTPPAITPAPTATQPTWATVAPILTRSCIGCHGPEKQKGGLRLDSVAVLNAGKHPSVVAGDPDHSPLVLRPALPADDDDHMPPAPKPALSADDLATLRAWIAAGAKP